MAERDNIWRAAYGLSTAVVDQVVTSFSARSPTIDSEQERAVVGRMIEEVLVKGKHILVVFTGQGENLVLHTQLRINGTWHIYRPGERWQRARAGARVVIATAQYVVGCFDAPTVELLRESKLAKHPSLSKLGSDAVVAGFDIAEARGSLRLNPDREIGTALLDQRVIIGVGNVLKSEALFAARTSPFALVRALDDQRLDVVLEEVHRSLLLSWRDIHRGSRRSLDQRDGLRVYGRAGDPCGKCGASIRLAAQGEESRPSYWCPSCQT